MGLPLVWANRFSHHPTRIFDSIDAGGAGLSASFANAANGSRSGSCGSAHCCAASAPQIPAGRVFDGTGSSSDCVSDNSCARSTRRSSGIHGAAGGSVSHVTGGGNAGACGFGCCFAGDAQEDSCEDQEGWWDFHGGFDLPALPGLRSVEQALWLAAHR